MEFDSPVIYEAYDGAYPAADPASQRAFPIPAAEQAAQAATDWTDMRAALPDRLRDWLGQTPEEIEAFMATVPEQRPEQRESPMLGAIPQYSQLHEGEQA
jgi:hypothetical protein